MTEKKLIYADNAATTKLAPEALAAMMPYLTEAYGNASSLYSFSRSARAALDTARETIAECIGAEPEEIFFTSGGTESNNWAIKGRIPLGKLLVSSIEHHSILNALIECDKYPESGLPHQVAVDRQGVFSLRGLETSLSHRVSLVSVMTANNEIGTLEPIPDIAEMVHRYEAVVHTDAVQAVGHIPLNVKRMGVDLLSASAHKFNGPKGIGFLYCRRGVVLRKFMDGGQQERNERAGTENAASIVGMATALNLNVEQMPETTERLRRMEQKFREIILEAIPDAVFNGHPEHHLPGHISVAIPGISGEGMMHMLDLQGIMVSTGAACDTQSTQISHVLQAIRLARKFATGTVRVTFGRYNAEEDAEIAAKNILAYYTKLKNKL